jgi:hypothetical protein
MTVSENDITGSVSVDWKLIRGGDVVDWEIWLGWDFGDDVNDDVIDKLKRGRILAAREYIFRTFSETVSCNSSDDVMWWCRQNNETREEFTEIE